MAYTRISARRGQDVNLDASFYQGGIAADPFALYRVEIFRGSVSDANIVAAFDVSSPESSDYPSPIERQPEIAAAQQPCPSPPASVDCVGTEPINDAGKFRLAWSVPSDLVVPDIYFDVWYFFSTDPRIGTEPLSDHVDKLLKQCNRFWVYPDNWYVDGGLDTIRLGFEPIDIKFKKPESRPLEVGIMPLPLYDYNYNLVMPIIPFLQTSISIWTDSREIVVTNDPCIMKLRQGSFRSNPWVISYMLNTCNLFMGTYRYRVKAILPDGSSRVSGDFYFTVS